MSSQHHPAPSAEESPARPRWYGGEEAAMRATVGNAGSDAGLHDFVNAED